MNTMSNYKRKYRETDSPLNELVRLKRNNGVGPSKYVLDRRKKNPIWDKALRANGVFRKTNVYGKKVREAELIDRLVESIPTDRAARWNQRNRERRNQEKWNSTQPTKDWFDEFLDKEKLERAKRRSEIKGRGQLGQIEIEWKSGTCYLVTQKSNHKRTYYSLGTEVDFHDNIMKLERSREFRGCVKEILFKAYYAKEFAVQYEVLTKETEWTAFQRERDLNRFKRKIEKQCKWIVDEKFKYFTLESFYDYINKKNNRL
jgi:hypothetical protein